MALSVPRGVGSKVPVPDLNRDGKGVFGSGHPGDLWICWVRSSRIERASGSCASGVDDSAEGIGIGVAGAFEGADIDEDVPAVPAFEEEALLGESLLGQRLLCRHGGIGCGHDTEVCPLPGKERTADGATSADRLIIIVAAQLTGPAPLGVGPCPPYGGTF